MNGSLKSNGISSVNNFSNHSSQNHSNSKNMDMSTPKFLPQIDAQHAVSDHKVDNLPNLDI